MAITNTYNVETDNLGLTYEFTSEGPAGRILKRVQFSLYDNNLKVYNLALGDVQADDELNDAITTNNSDVLKVLTTVAYCMYDFLKHYSDSSIIAIGNTLSRNRLYRMAISNHLYYLPPSVYLYGLNDEGWEQFKKGENYKVFLITQKPLNL